MRFKPSAWPIKSSALRRGDSMPFCSKKPVVRLMISRTVSISIVVVHAGADRQGAAGQGGKLLLEVRPLQRLDDRLDLPLHDGGQAVKRQPDAMVGHAVLGKIVGADAFAA